MPRGGARPGAGRKRKPRVAIAPPAELKTAIGRAKDLTLRLLSELDAVTAHIGEIEDLILAETDADEDGGRRRAAMLKAVSLGARSTVLKVLLTATRAWAELEGGKTNPKPPFGPQPSADAPPAPQGGWDFLDSEVPKRTN
jgi:hypothetical protein